MGMDLKARKPSEKLLSQKEKYDHYDETVWIRYNFVGWEYLSRFIRQFKLRPLPQTNDGYLVTEKKCKQIAKILTENKERLLAEGLEFLIEDIEFWEECGGLRVY